MVPDQGSVPGPVYNFSHDRFLQGIKSTVFVNAPAGFYYTGDPGFPDRTGIHNQWAHFAPRLGLAWDVTRRIRGSEKSRGNPTHGQSDDQAPAGVCSGPIIWSPARRGGVIRCAGRRVAVPSLPAGRKVVSLFSCHAADNL